MHTSLFLVALLVPSAAPAKASQSLKWQDSYGIAREMGRQHSKPLAVFIGNGPTGWKKVVEEGNLSEKAKRVLAEGYVCLYVDRTKPGGEQLASSFEIPSGPGLVLSSRDGEGQAFFHAGKLAGGDIDARLAKYTSAEAITRTEMLVDSRTSYAYDPTTSGSPAPRASNAPQMQHYPRPSFGGSTFGGHGGGIFRGGFGGGRGSAGC